MLHKLQLSKGESLEIVTWVDGTTINDLLMQDREDDWSDHKNWFCFGFLSLTLCQLQWQISSYCRALENFLGWSCVNNSTTVKPDILNMLEIYSAKQIYLEAENAVLTMHLLSTYAQKLRLLASRLLCYEIKCAMANDGFDYSSLFNICSTEYETSLNKFSNCGSLKFCIFSNKKIQSFFPVALYRCCYF